MDPLPAGALRRFIEGHGDRLIRQGELRRALGVGDRTLRRLFAATYGVSPSRFLRVRRMELARKSLLRGRDARVTDAGLRYGFYDLGRFASEYRRLFDELPSETLRRRRGPTA